MVFLYRINNQLENINVKIPFSIAMKYIKFPGINLPRKRQLHLIHKYFFKNHKILLNVIKKSAMFFNRKIQYAKVLPSPQIINKFNVMPIEVPKEFLM